MNAGEKIARTDNQSREDAEVGTLPRSSTALDNGLDCHGRENKERGENATREAANVEGEGLTERQASMEAEGCLTAESSGGGEGGGEDGSTSGSGHSDGEEISAEGTS
jgi:hypothetical protein